MILGNGFKVGFDLFFSQFITVDSVTPKTVATWA